MRPAAANAASCSFLPFASADRAVERRARHRSARQPVARSRQQRLADVLALCQIERGVESGLGYRAAWQRAACRRKHGLGDRPPCRQRVRRAERGGDPGADPRHERRHHLRQLELVAHRIDLPDHRTLQRRAETLPARKSRPGIDRYRGRPHAKPALHRCRRARHRPGWDFADRVRGLAGDAGDPAGGAADRSHQAAQEIFHFRIVFERSRTAAMAVVKDRRSRRRASLASHARAGSP